ncbi:serine hydrolase domain-containing protein [Phytomonospora endophytica]|uniref:D-alanyl-D-alanine carboxypeptidase n=1 Tax=Phytomonospora endophytica TaxID=714109 RepID=A0A841G155_9ACTN|nr:serine hydrolase domain-containing protein [Phytomonospora endophytica]MBB6038409.1 D-alanyl-D-alanine carboxypeptidase [Phytomonospora endophytica]GIG64339.1 serine hydrolase [Phytomonospora endophytica]
MTKILLTTLTAMAALAGTVAAPPPAGASAGYTRAEFRADLDHLNELGVIGVQGRVVLADGTVWTATSGVADVRTERPVPANGHFRIASNTKTFVATVVLQLVAEGRLGLDDTVERHLPGVVAGNGNDGSAITVRDLLQHTSGLYDYSVDVPGSGIEEGDDGFRRHRFDHYEPAELVAMAVAHPPHFPPGTDFRYSNTGYVLAGMIIERTTGRSWAEEVDRRIVEPLRLRHTTVPGDDPFMPAPYARAYQQWDLGTPPTDTSFYNPTRSDAAGAMVSTTADLGRFFRALFAGELLPPGQLEEMKTTVEADGGIAAGYGLGVYENRLTCGGTYWDHGGNTIGVISRGGVTEDGTKSVSLVFTGAHGDSMEDIAAMREYSERIIDRVFCG